MKTMKVVDIQDSNPQDNHIMFDQSHEIATEWAGCGNDSYYKYTIGEFVGEDYDMETDALDEWLIYLGLEQGETILINHWW